MTQNIRRLKASHSQLAVLSQSGSGLSQIKPKRHVDRKKEIKIWKLVPVVGAILKAFPHIYRSRDRRSLQGERGGPHGEGAREGPALAREGVGEG